MPFIGNIHDLKWAFDHEIAMKQGSPIHIDTPYLEVRVILLKPGVYPPYHAHHEEMDEGYLIFGGTGLIHNSGETFGVQKGDVLLNPRGRMHHMKNVGADELIEYNFRGGKMPSGFLMPEGDPPPSPDPESVGKTAATPVPYILGKADALAGRYDAGTIKQKGNPRAISTEYLELRIVRFAPGDQPGVHRHQKEMDEATLVLEGTVEIDIEGEKIEAGPGDLVHVPGGAWHDLANRGENEALVFNAQGGELPVVSEWKD